MKIYGLVGFPLSHSFSQGFFIEKFEREGQFDSEYEQFEMASLDGFREWAEAQENLEGFNVTIPHKSSIIPYLDQITDEAKAIGAVNTVKVVMNNGKKELHGYNTDVVGFKESLQKFVKKGVNRAIVLGTGGSSKAIGYVLKSLNVDTTFVSRNPGPNCVTYDQLSKDALRTTHLIINTTPLGMFPNIDSCPDIPFEVLGKNHILFDLIYNPGETRFLKQGRTQGASVKNGLEMLMLQAEGSWKIWSED